LRFKRAAERSPFAPLPFAAASGCWLLAREDGDGDCGSTMRKYQAPGVLLGDAGQVLAGAGVDLNDIAGLNEQRHLDLSTGLQGGWLGTTGGTVALQARIGVLDLEVNVGWQLSEQRLAVVEGHVDAGVFQQELRAIAHELWLQFDLSVGLVIHEDVGGAIVAQVGHVAAVDGVLLDLHTCVEGLVHGLAGDDVLELRAHKRRALTWLDVLELYDLLQLAVEHQGHTVFEICSG